MSLTGDLRGCNLDADARRGLQRGEQGRHFDETVDDVFGRGVVGRPVLPAAQPDGGETRLVAPWTSLTGWSPTWTTMAGVLLQSRAARTI